MPRYHSFVSIDPASESGIIAPQEVYEAPRDGHIPGPIISFVHNGTPGVPLAIAARNTFVRGDYATTGMTDGNTIADIRTQDGRIKLRILWPGHQPYSKSIIVTVAGGRHGEPRLLTKAELAHKIAGAVQDFLRAPQRASNWATEGNPDWAPGRFEFSRFILHELHDVSRGSYQPVLAISI